MENLQGYKNKYTKFLEKSPTQNTIKLKQFFYIY